MSENKNVTAPLPAVILETSAGLVMLRRDS
jgi:hypothetical protein